MSAAREERSLTLVTWTAAAIAALMIAQQIASKAIRDGYFLNAFEATALPIAVAVASVLSFGVALFLGRIMRRFTPARVVPVSFGVSALLFFGEAQFIESAPRVVACALYLHVVAVSSAVVSGFWSVINERFDPFTARRAMGRIAGGATIGGMAGGAATWLVADLQPAILLASLGAANALAGVGLYFIAGSQEADTKPRDQAASNPDNGFLDGLRMLWGASYPRILAALVFLTALATACFDYVFKAQVDGAPSEGTSLVGFFALFYTGTGIATFLFQSLGSDRILKGLGVLPAVALLPLTMFVFLGAALVFPHLWTVVALRGVSMMVENSLYRSGYELLYTPMAPDQKRSAKVLIDLGADRLGGALGGAVALLAVTLVAAYANWLLLLLSLAITGVIIGLLYGVRREYTGALAARVQREGEPNTQTNAYVLSATFAAESALPLSVTPTKSVSASSAMTRQSILAEVERRLHRRESAAGDDSTSDTKARDEKDTPTVNGSSPDPQMSLHAVPAAVAPELLHTPLLAMLVGPHCTEETSPEWARLRASAPGLVGQLTDIVLSTRHAIQTRIRAAELLATVSSERSVVGLFTGLRATEFRIRRACALALLAIRRRAPMLMPTRTTLMTRVDWELRHPVQRALTNTRFEGRSPFHLDATGHPIAPSLELVFVLLALHGDEAALQQALRAATSVTLSRRGAGLEYLDNLLPQEIRRRLVSLLAKPEKVRATNELPADTRHALAAKLRARTISLAELRRAARDAQQETPNVASTE